MITTLLLSSFLGGAPDLYDASETSAALRAKTLQVQATTVLLGDGTKLENGIVLVRDGKIVGIERGGKLDEAMPSVTHDGYLTAGLVACQGELGANGEAYDATRSFLPEARMAHAFSPGHSDFQRALRNGITTVVLTPTEENPIGGLTSVVKTHGGTILSPEAHLAMSFTTTALAGGNLGFFFRFRAAQAADGDLENTANSSSGARTPTSHSGLLRELNDQLENGTGALERVRTGKLPVLMEAWDRNEVVRAARFAAANGLKGTVRGLPLASDPYVIAALETGGLSAILGPYGPSQKRRSLESARALAEAGVPFAFALDAPHHAPESLRWTAAAALGAGADHASVWKALTKDAAVIAGVANRVGDLAPGLDADLVLWSGDPLNLASRVDAVFVQGQRVHSN
ncbi:MAG: amidohydrolase family protein [Planctomycetota bacterium]